MLETIKTIVVDDSFETDLYTYDNTIPHNVNRIEFYTSYMYYHTNPTANNLKPVLVYTDICDEPIADLTDNLTWDADGVGYKGYLSSSPYKRTHVVDYKTPRQFTGSMLISLRNPDNTRPDNSLIISLVVMIKYQLI